MGTGTKGPFGTSAAARTGRLLLALLVVLGALVGCSNEEPGPRVEIVALNHPPLEPVVTEIEKTLKPYEGKVSVQRVDAESDAGRELLSNVGIEGHAALAVLINGEVEAEIDGSTVRFEGFPAGASPIESQEGAWTMADLDAVVKRVVAG